MISNFLSFSNCTKNSYSSKEKRISLLLDKSVRDYFWISNVSKINLYDFDAYGNQGPTR